MRASASSPEPRSSKWSPIQPPVCVSRCRVVTRAATSSSLSFSSGRYVRTGASRSSSPRSTRRIAAVPVNVFVIEPIWKSVSGVTSSGFSSDVTPKPATCSSPSCSSPTATPGRLRLFHRRADGVADPVEGSPHAEHANAECADERRPGRPRRRRGCRAPRGRAAGRSGARRRAHRALGRQEAGARARDRGGAAAGLEPRRALVGRRALRAGRRRAFELRDGEAHAARQARRRSPRASTAFAARSIRPLRPTSTTPRSHGVRLRLNVLGIGPDGHTASLFPHAPGLHERERLAIAAEPGLDPRVMRVTMTPPMLANADCVLFLVTGEEKATRSGWPSRTPASDETPASRIRARDGRTIAVLDRAAAAGLSSI